MHRPPVQTPVPLSKAQPTSIGLLDWCQSPEPVPWTLPPLDLRTRRGSWPIGELPADALATDLTGAGITYRDGLGYAMHGVRTDAEEVARVAAKVLDRAARLLPAFDSREAEYEWQRGYVAALRARLAEVPPNVAEDEGWVIACERAQGALRRTTEAQARAELLAAQWSDRDLIRLALQDTARDLRQSALARRALVSLVRRRLPAPAPDVVDSGRLDAFLATYDASPILRRSALGQAYDMAGRPGNASPTQLRAAAAARWGAPTKSHGIYVYRPAPDYRP